MRSKARCTRCIHYEECDGVGVDCDGAYFITHEQLKEYEKEKEDNDEEVE